MYETVQTVSPALETRQQFPTGPEALIQILDLQVFYGNLQVLNKVNISIDGKKITAFIGPSGCGKTTLIRTLNRMNDRVPGFRITGSVKIAGKNIYDDDVDPVLLKMRVGMVFQKPNPLPLSIYDNVAFGPRIHNFTKKKYELDRIVSNNLKRVGLWEEVKDRLKESAMKLSGGQQQRLCIARALALNPQILLLDEPASALDPGSTSKIEDLMVELKNNYSIVLVSHNMQQAARVSDDVVFMYRGDIVEVGKTAEVFKNPKDPLTEKYVSGNLT